MRLGIITSGDEHFQLPKLERMGLADRFEHVIASGALGITKPDRRIFEFACEKFRVPVSDALYVGCLLYTSRCG